MTYPITGIQTGLGPQDDPLRVVPIRREIDEWWSSNDLNTVNQKSLFILALQYFEQMDPTDMLSYFQVAGIHGQPLTTWDEESKPDTDGGPGYCVHGTPIFATWHRPYVLLLEQRLYEIMKNQIIPQQFDPSQQAELQQAADTWRLPYWDWAIPKPDWHNPQDPNRHGLNVPQIITMPRVSVRTATGSQDVDNPMWKFSAPTNMGQYGITSVNGEPFGDCIASVRQPADTQPGTADFEADFVQGQDQNWDPITSNLRGSIQSNTLPEAVYRLMITNYTTSYNIFATTQSIRRGFPPSYLSLEGIHNNIHTWTGGTGHMAFVPVAAFDPIFWLHHNNVERLACIWQDLHPGPGPNNWLDPNGPPRPGPNPDDPLTPFHSDDNGTHWTSNAVKDWRPLGYTYPELQKWLPQYQTAGQFDSNKYVAAIRTQIDQLYSTTADVTRALRAGKPVAKSLAEGSSVKSNPSTTSAGQHAPPTAASSHVKALEKTAKPAQVPLGVPPGSTNSSDSKWEENDYIVNVRYERFCRGGSPFTIRIFLGATPSPASSPTSGQPSYNFGDTPNQLGCVYNFSSLPELMGRNAAGCSNCQRQEAEHTLLAGQVIITDPLVEHVQQAIPGRNSAVLHSLSRDDVVTYLKNNLHWVVTDTRGQNIPLETLLPGLKVTVAAGKATHYAEDGRLSEYRDYEILWDVTRDKVGGGREGDDV